MGLGWCGFAGSVKSFSVVALVGKTVLQVKDTLSSDAKQAPSLIELSQEDGSVLVNDQDFLSCWAGQRIFVVLPLTVKLVIQGT